MSPGASALVERREEALQALAIGPHLLDAWIAGRSIPATLFRRKLVMLGIPDDWDEPAIPAKESANAIADEPAASGSILDQYDRIDAALVKAGWPATSPWWRAQIERYFTTKAGQIVFRVGRRGGKSSTLCRVAVVEALYGDHEIPPGDTGVVAFISVSREEAQERLTTISAILDVLGTEYRQRGAARIDLVNRPIAFRVFAATVGGVSGFTGICVICDEVAKWHDASMGANPASEVLASVRPTMATMPSAKIVLSSSPLGELDAHAAAYSEGETALQIIAWAPTWVAHPALTEEETHKREPNELRWKREYGAIPLEGTEDGIFTSYLLDRATRDAAELPFEDGAPYVAWMDPATRGNAWTFAIGTRRWVGEVCKSSIALCCQWQGSPSAPLDPAVILARISVLCRQYGLETVHSDQHHGDSLRSIGRRLELCVVIEPTTERGKMARYEGLSERLACGEAELPPDKQVRADLLSVTRHLTPNGFTIRLPTTGDGRHADYAPTIAGALGWRLPEPDRPRKPIVTAEERAAAEAERLNTFAREHWAKLNERARKGIQEESDERLEEFFS